MANHILSLNVPPVMNGCVLKIQDTSVYSDYLTIACPTLQVTVPGFTYSNQFDFTPNGEVVITACDLQLQTDNCEEQLLDIPDGIYIIKYSVSPNDLVYVEYNHMRITKALQKYNEALCELDLSNCEPTQKIKETLDKLRMIKMYLDAAKAKVEYCHEPDKGMILYNYALKLLNKLSCTNC